MLITLPFFLKGYQRSFRNTIDFTTIRRSQLKDKLFKKPSLISWVIWKRIDKTGQMTWSQFFIKIVGERFGNSVLDNSNWDKISHGLTKKKINISNRVQLFLGWKKNPLIQTLIYKWDIYYSEIYQRGNLKNNRSTLHLEASNRYFRHRYSLKLSRS